MDPYVSEWLNLIIRWIHMIVGIAWIGASFYFNWLEGNLNRKGPHGKGIAGDLWAVHGGGFYHVEKYEVAPEKLPETLHWFKWEAYWTWISGMSLLFVVYYLAPNVYLIDRSVADISSFVAIASGLSIITLCWLGYHKLCSTKIAEKPTLFFAIVFVSLTLVALLLTQLFNARAAYIHVGAVIGTIMVFNVFFVIMPSQRYLVDTLTKGGTPDPSIGKQGFIRSLHNNYFTLPVLFIMISNHYPVTFTHAWNWLVLAAISAIGIGVRHYFNLKNRGNRVQWILPVALLAMLSLAFVMSPQKLESDGSVVSNDAAYLLIDKHCTACHSATPTSDIFKTAPNGVTFDDVDSMLNNAAGIYARAVVSNSMPLGNPSGMTDDERQSLGIWFSGITATQ